MARGLLFLFGAWILFTVFVTVFAFSAKSSEVRALPKWLWVLICIFVPIIGGLLYLAFGRPIGGSKRSFGRTRVIAPDDDPQFLRDLSERLKKEEGEENKKTEDDESDKDSDGKKPD